MALNKIVRGAITCKIERVIALTGTTLDGVAGTSATRVATYAIVVKNND
jgi:hypothetical protein